MNRIPPPPERPATEEYHVAEISICATESRAGTGHSHVFNFNYTRGMKPYIVRSHNLKSVLEVLAPNPKPADDREHAPGPESYFFDCARVVWVRQKVWDPAIHEVTEEDTDGDDTGRESEGESEEALDTEGCVLVHANGDSDLHEEWSSRFFRMLSQCIHWYRNKSRI